MKLRSRLDENLIVSIKTADSVLSLKQQFLTQKQVVLTAQEKVRLVFNGREMQDSHPINEYRIRNGCTISVFL